MHTWETKHPATMLDYIIDWTKWLNRGDSLNTVVWSLSDDTGLVIEGESQTANKTTIILSGGDVDETAYVTCDVTTTLGLVHTVTVRLMIRD